MPYSEMRREQESAARAGAGDLRDRVLAQLRSQKFEVDAAERSAAELAYRKGWNEALASIERWLEGRQ